MLQASFLGMGRDISFGSDTMYFHGLFKDESRLQNDIDLNSEQERVEPVSMVILFGRQVFPMQSESSQPVDEQGPRNLKREIDLCIPADPYIDNLNREVEHDKFCSLGCSRGTAHVELCSGLRSEAKEASTLNKRSLATAIDLEGPPLQKETEHSAPVNCAASNSCVERNKSLVDDDGRCCGKWGFSDKGYRVGDTSSSKQSFVSCEPCLLDLNETPVDEPCPGRRHYFLQDLNCPYSENTTPSCEKSGVEDPAPFCTPRSRNVVDKDGTSSPASYTSCCTTENNSRIKSVPSCRTRLEYPETEALPREPTNGCCNEEDSSETSSFMQMAAESLVHISCNSSYQDHQDLASKPESRSNDSSRDRDLSSKQPRSGNAEPECSYDSYELLTLELTETSPEENCASSKAGDELNITGEGKELGVGIGFKLRRGRRMKNFQKEILPGLVSLSRHEICEDINVLEAVLRSREYKKMHGNTGDDKCGKNRRKRGSGSGQRLVGRRKKQRR